jgi:hypothetical protein
VAVEDVKPIIQVSSEAVEDVKPIPSGIQWGG